MTKVSGRMVFGAAKQFEAVHAGHLEVGEDDVDLALAEEVEGFGAAGGGGDVVAHLGDGLGEGLAAGAVVVDDEDRPRDPFVSAHNPESLLSKTAF